MEVSTQIKRYRGAAGLSQEDLAERIYVTRQTISNWETGKSYPDIHSLLLLSSLFNISLDQLIKGDIETMKKEINQAEVAEFNWFSTMFGILFLLCILAFVPLVVFLKTVGAVLWAVLFLITMGFAIKVEKLKKNHDLQTYREIVAFSEGKSLDEVQAQREIGKRPYQAMLWPLLGAGIGIALAGIAWILLEFLK